MSTMCVGLERARSQARRSPASTNSVAMPEARQEGRDDPVAGAEKRAAGDHPVASAQMAEHAGVHRRHARGGGAAILGALQQGEAALEGGDGGVAEAGVLIVGDGAVEGRFRLLGIVVNEAGGEKHRLAGLAIRGAVEAALDEGGGRPVCAILSHGGQLGAATLRRQPSNPIDRLPARGCSSMVERQLPKLHTRVRFPSPAPVRPFACLACTRFPCRNSPLRAWVGSQAPEVFR